MRAWIAIGAALLAGCGDGDAPASDAAVSPMDAGRDAGAPLDAAHDAGQHCTMACGSGLVCCLVGGAPTCVDPVTDIANCGTCGISCAPGRGFACERGMCVCGTADIGCAGTRVSTCCAATSDAGRPYCANFENSGANCGGCGRACEPAQASLCNGGTCQCGAEGRACTGAPDDVCCIDATVGEAACVDTLTDRRNCGQCNERCVVSETCTSGTCTRGTTCATPCAVGEICCDGTCCARSACDRGAC